MRILAKGYLPISLVTPYKLQEIINLVKETLIKSNPDYDVVIKRLHLYYDMKSVTFRIDQKRNFIIQFPIFVQPYMQQPLILSQLETVPIIDQNPNVQSYTELKIKKPYIALNSETYINIQQEELAICKRIRYEFYCKELFIVRKAIHNCKSTIYFNLGVEIIKQNCNILFYFNKSDITPTVLDNGSEIILANIVKIMLFISDVQYYVPAKLNKTEGSIHLFKITGKIMMDKVKPNKYYIWDVLEIDWSEVKVTFNGKVINLPKSISVRLWDQFKVRQMIGSQPLLFHLMLKQGFNWFMLTQEDQEVDEV